MKHLSRLIISILTSIALSLDATTVPYISIRSQSVDAARDLMGWTDKVNLYDMENLYAVGALTLEGTRSFDPDALAHCLFGFGNVSTLASDEFSINVTGSQVVGRLPTDWLADYFGLPTDFQSTLVFKPRVSNIILDFNFYVGLDECLNGLYFRVHAPLVATRWNLNFHENLLENGANAYPAGYFAPSAVPRSSLLSQAEDFFSDEDVPTLPNGVTFESLAFAQFEQTRQSKSALAEIQMALGYNFLLCQDYHFGFNFRVYAPTGNRPLGLFVFEPICGNGKHWEVGIGYTGHYTFWESDDEESSFGFYSDGNFTHMCRAHQTRTFDLIGLPDSRYMLAERLGLPANPPNLYGNPAQGTAAGSTVPSAQFANAYAPVANLSTIPVNVSAAIQADIVALFNYTTCGLSVDVGYNFWGRSCEKITVRMDEGPLRLASGNVWALKGDANVYGFVAENAVIPPPPPSFTAGQAIALSATESTATINAGTNAGSNLNPGVDNAQYAMFSTFDNSDQLVAVPGADGGLGSQTMTSIDPVFLSLANLNLTGTRGISHKIFAHISYTWTECEDIVPYVGVGGKAEFGPRHNDMPCNPNTASCIINSTPPLITCNQCKNCQTCNLSEWGVWIKGGLFWS